MPIEDDVIFDHEISPRGDAPSVVGTHAFATFGSAFDACRNGRTMAVDDLEASDVIRSEDKAGFRALLIRSLINTPLVKGSRSVAGVTVLKMTPNKWTAQQISLVEEVAERTWAAVERARRGRDAGKRGASPRRPRSGRMGTWRWDLQNRLIWGDALFLELWGFPPSDGPHALSIFTDRMSSSGMAEMELMVTRAIEASEEFDGQLEIVAGPTAGHWSRWRGRAHAGAPSLLYGVTLDVTAQRKLDERLREHDDRHSGAHWAKAASKLYRLNVLAACSVA